MNCRVQYGLALLLTCAFQFAQGQVTLRHESDFRLWTQYRQLSNTGFQLNGFAPYLTDARNMDSIMATSQPLLGKTDPNSVLARKLFREHVVQVDEPDFYMTIDPVLDIRAMSDASDTKRFLYNNTRGIEFNAALGKRISLNSSFLETQSLFPNYMDSVARARESVPAMGRYKALSTGVLDYSVARGSVAYVFNRSTYIQAGSDDNFIGYGQRSLLLGRSSFPYPFLKLNVGLLKHKLQITTVYASMQSLTRIVRQGSFGGREPLFVRYASKFHYISYTPFSWLSVGVFDGSMWKQWNRREGSQPLPWDYFSPLPFVSSGQSADSTIGSRVSGLNWRVNPKPWLMIYGQFGLRSGQSATGLQVGARLLQPFEIKGLNLLLEYNQVDNGFYSQGTSGDENYHHYGQPVGHNLGDGISEFRATFQYAWQQLYFRLGYLVYQAEYLSPADEVQTNAVDVLKPELGYVINPSYNLNIHLGAYLREADVLPQSTQLIYFGISTNFVDRNPDF